MRRRPSAWLCLVLQCIGILAQENFVIKGPGLQAREAGLQAASEGRFAEAVPFLRRAIQSPPTTSAAEKQRVAVDHNALGGALKALDRPDEAALAFQRAISTLETLEDGVGLKDLAVVVNNLGSVHADKGRVSEAESLYKRALQLASGVSPGDEDEDEGGDDSVNVIGADALNNLADLRHGAGRLDEARELHERALAIRERALGPNNHALAGSLNNVAVLLMDLKKHDEALPLLKRAAVITGHTSGRGHPEHATALSNLAGVLLQLQRPAEALPHLKRALEVNKVALGEEHSSTKATADSLRACEAALQVRAASPVAGSANEDGERKRKRKSKAKASKSRSRMRVKSQDLQEQALGALGEQLAASLSPDT